MHGHVRLVTLAVLIVVFLVVATTARTQAPQNEKGPAIKACAHEGYQFWDGLKVLPVRFIEIDRNTVTARHPRFQAACGKPYRARTTVTLSSSASFRAARINLQQASSAEFALHRTDAMVAASTYSVRPSVHSNS